MNKLKKVFNCEIKQVGEESDRILRFIGSDETPDRDRDIIEVAGWKLEDYMKNPVFLWAHNYDEPPVGKAVSVMADIASKKLLFDIKFPTAEEYPFADTIYKLYKGGYLSATSVGFHGVKYKTRDEEEVLNMPEWQRGRRYMEQELLELSGVPVPCNPNALQTVRSKGFKTEDIDKIFIEEKGVIPYKKYPTAEEGTVWDGPAEIAAASVEDLKTMCAWFDSENADVEQSYKLPHHRQSDKNTVWRGVRAAMGALLGARDGVQIPDADRKGVYNHLSKHYADFDKEPPEFKAYAEAELKSMFPEDLGLKEVSLLVDTNSKEVFVLENGQKTAKVKIAPEYYERLIEIKSGATLSTKNRELLNSIHAGFDEGTKKLKEFLDSVMPMNPDDEPMMMATRTAPINEMTVKLPEEFKQALEEIKSQVLLLSQKMTAESEKPDANKAEIDLDAIELPKAAKDPAEIELNIEPGELKNMIKETVKNLIQGGN